MQKSWGQKAGPHKVNNKVWELRHGFRLRLRLIIVKIRVGVRH